MQAFVEGTCSTRNSITNNQIKEQTFNHYNTGPDAPTTQMEMDSSSTISWIKNTFLCGQNTCRPKHLFILLMCLILVILLVTRPQLQKLTVMHVALFSNDSHGMDEMYKITCANVLSRAVVGRWVQRASSRQEVADLDYFFKLYRKTAGMNETLQRPDGNCGNVHLEGPGEDGKLKTLSFRALCDPKGSVPCCFENKCVSKSVEECRCEHCHDIRQQIHAELSTWIPADPTCQIVMYKGEQDTCRLLRDTTIFFIGDSFMRQLYISVLNLVRENNPLGTLHEQTTPEQRSECTGHFRLINKCASSIPMATMDCLNRTKLRLISYWKSDQTNNVIKDLAELQGRPNTFIIFGAGIHEGFDLDAIENKILKPIVQYLAKSPWPIPIWMSTHSVGLLKAPMYANQQTEQVVRYNLKMNKIVRKMGVAVMDFYQMTDHVWSFDGTHYGTGANDLKAQILLNHILEVRLKQNV